MSDDRAERLRAYVEAVRDVPANFDGCSTWPAQWIVDETGREFDWPVFDDRDDMIAYLESVGGLVNIWSGVAKQIGLGEVVGFEETPSIGDVGLIDTSKGPVGGIFAAAGSFCWRAEVGVRVLPAWGCTYPLRVDGKWERRPIVLKAWRV